MNASIGLRENLSASAFRALVRPTLGREGAQRYEDALLGKPQTATPGDARTAALLGFAGEIVEGTAAEGSVRCLLLPAFSEDEAFALVAFAGVVRKHRAVFESSDRGLTRIVTK